MKYRLLRTAPLGFLAVVAATASWVTIASDVDRTGQGQLSAAPEAGSIGSWVSATSADAAPVALEGEVFSTKADVDVTVSAVIWPSQGTLDRLPENAEVPLITIPTVAVEDNRFAVRLTPAQVPASHRSAEGVDVEVLASPSDGESAAYNETVVPDGEKWSRSRAAVSETNQVSAGRALGALPRADKVRLPGALVVGPGAHGREMAARAVPARSLTASGALLEEGLQLASEPICSTNKTTVTHDHRAKIADVMPSVNYMKGRVSYQIGTSHSLGVGMKAYNGAVSEGGTVTRSSAEQVVPEYRGADHTAKTTWRYRDYKNSCTQKITSRPESHQGGYYIASRSRPSYGHCQWYARGTWTSTNATAWTYQAGVTLWGVLNVNAQTGYNSDVKLSYNFPDRGKYLCGNNANPPSAALVAGR